MDRHVCLKRRGRKRKTRHGQDLLGGVLRGPGHSCWSLYAWPESLVPEAGLRQETARARPFCVWCSGAGRGAAVTPPPHPFPGSPSPSPRHPISAWPWTLLSFLPCCMSQEKNGLLGHFAMSLEPGTEGVRRLLAHSPADRLGEASVPEITARTAVLSCAERHKV